MKFLVSALWTILTSCFVSSCTHTVKEAPNSQRLLFVTTSHYKLGKTGKKTGAYISEITHPYALLTDAGYAVDFVSPKGGEVPLDGMESLDAEGEALLKSKVFKRKIMNSMTPDDVDTAKYQAVFFAGGHGTMFDLPNNRKLQEITRKIYENRGVVAAVCHGPAGLVNTKLSNGKYLVEGKKVAAFTNEEERAVGLTKEMPFLLESKLMNRGAKHISRPKFEKHAVVSGRLVTGQNPASAKSVGEEVLKLLRAKR